MLRRTRPTHCRIPDETEQNETMSGWYLAFKLKINVFHSRPYITSKVQFWISVIILIRHITKQIYQILKWSHTSERVKTFKTNKHHEYCVYINIVWEHQFNRKSTFCSDKYVTIKSFALFEESFMVILLFRHYMLYTLSLLLVGLDSHIFFSYDDMCDTFII